MSTRISKSVALNAIAVVSMLLAAVLNIFVIERFVAGVAMLYKFAFEWPAPIYMSLSTVMLFVAVVCVLAVGNRMCSAMFRDKCWYFGSDVAGENSYPAMKTKRAERVPDSDWAHPMLTIGYGARVA